MEKETLVIKSTEKISEVFKDSSRKSSFERRPKGYVEIYERNPDGTEKQLVGKCNLVVLQGREIIGQKLTNVNNTGAVSQYNEFIYWFGLGTGGVSGADPFDPDPPLSTDTDLTSEVLISTSDATNCSDLVLGTFYKHKIDNVEFEVDPENENAWLITKITITIGIEDSLHSPEYIISEAGLFTCSSNTPGEARSDPSQFHLFARITFPGIVKTNTRELVFLWYIYT